MDTNQILAAIAELSQEFGQETYVRGGGGNTSCKTDEILFIKPSGVTLAEMTPDTFAGLDRARLDKLFGETFPADVNKRERAVLEFITATVLPGDATDKTVTWSSDKPEIATVDPQTGEVTAIKEGTAIITATTTDGGFTDSGTITVKEYYEDKDIIQLQSATKGNGITLIFMPDGYTREHMRIGTGEFETVVRKGVEYYFKSDPICRYREYFDVWMVVGIGNQAGISIASGTTTTAATNVDTAFGVLGRSGTATNMNFKGSSTDFSVRAEKALSYIDEAILVATGDTKRDYITVVMPVNCSNTSNAWRGTAWTWAGPTTTPGFGICLMGVDKGSNWDNYGRLMTHGDTDSPNSRTSIRAIAGRQPLLS